MIELWIKLSFVIESRSSRDRLGIETVDMSAMSSRALVSGYSLAQAFLRVRALLRSPFVGRMNGEAGRTFAFELLPVGEGLLTFHS